MKTAFPRLTRPPRRPQSLLHRLHARLHRLPAHLTSEDDWRQDAPGIKLSRVFGIVLVIHLVAIGGLMAYEMFRHKEPAGAATAALKPATREVRPAPSPPPASAAQDNPAAADPANEGLKTHVVAPGEKLSDIAALYQVDEQALVAKNKIGSGHPLGSGMKLVIPNTKLVALAAPPDPRKLLAGTPPAVPVPTEKATPAPPASVPPVGSTAAPTDKPVRRALPVVEKERKPSVEGDAVGRPSSKMVATRQGALAATKAAPSAAKAPSATPKAKGKVHIVKDGETAYRIARSYGVNVDQLIRTNGIKPDKLRPGTSLIIPSDR